MQLAHSSNAFQRLSEFSSMVSTINERKKVDQSNSLLILLCQLRLAVTLRFSKRKMKQNFESLNLTNIMLEGKHDKVGLIEWVRIGSGDKRYNRVITLVKPTDKCILSFLFEEVQRSDMKSPFSLAHSQYPKFDNDKTASDAPSTSLR